MRILKLIKMAKKYYFQLFTAALSLTLTSLLSLVVPEVVRRVTAFLQTGSKNEKTLILFVAILVITYFARSLFRFLSMWIAHVAAWGFVGDLISIVYDKYQLLSQRYHKNMRTGESMSRMMNDTRMMEVLFAHALPDLFSSIILIIGVAVMIFLINPILALFTLIPVPFVFYAGIFFSKKVAPLFRINQKTWGELNSDLQDNISGMKEIQAFCKEECEHERVRGLCVHYSKVNIRANFANAIFNPTVDFLISMGTAVVVGAGGVLAMHGTLEIADIIGFLMYLSLFYQPLSTLSRVVEDVQSALAGGDRVLEILSEKPDIYDSENAAELERSEGNVAFENVSFSYEDGEQVLNNLSFTSPKGTTTAIVGTTGAGKTTIVSLLERFYDPDSGTIKIDGNDIKNITLKSLRSQLSMVLQDVFLFNGTIYDNIAYGSENPSREKVLEAAKNACCDEFVNAMPKGYDTVIGERGAKLSGGQKQRIAIARAILRDTPVLILDEATSAVDNTTEKHIQKAIDNLSGKKTIIVIAHRLSTIRKADNIFVIENGSVAESGSHDALIAKGGIYASLCSTNDGETASV